MDRAEKVGNSGKAVAVALAVAEVQVVVEVQAVAVAVAVVTEMEVEKEMFQVDVSGNNWKIDLPQQPLSRKSHMCGRSRKLQRTTKLCISKYQMAR